MNRHPRISVIMPVQNCGQWLELAVSSILNQSFEDFELLIIDDNSFDGSIESLPNDNRIKVFRHTGTGIVSSLNAGLVHADGEFIARMDGDDLSAPHRFASQLRYAEEHPHIGIIGGLVEIFSEDNDIQRGNREYQYWLNSVITAEDINREIFVESPLVHPSTLIRKTVFKKIGLYRDLSWPEDYDLWLRAWLEGIQIAKVNEYIFHWREHPHRLTHLDKRYSPKEFIKLKAWALAQSYLKHRAALICGTGKIAVTLCDSLLRLGVSVAGFIDVAPDKIGKTRRNLPILALDDAVAKSGDSLILGAVGARGARASLRDLLSSFQLKECEDFLMLC